MTTTSQYPDFKDIEKKWREEKEKEVRSRIEQEVRARLEKEMQEQLEQERRMIMIQNIKERSEMAHQAKLSIQNIAPIDPSQQWWEPPKQADSSSSIL